MSTVKHSMVRIGDIDIHPIAQRTEGVDEKRAARFATAFSFAKAGTVTLSDKGDGRFNCLDGAHRITAAKLAGLSDKRISANVHSGLALPEEAAIFLGLNDFKGPSAISKFNVRVVMEEPEAVEMNEVLASHGWRVRISSDPGTVAAVSAVERAYRSAGGVLSDGRYPEILDRTFGIITQAWEHDAKGSDGHVILGVAQLLGRMGPSVDSDKLAAELSNTRPQVLIGKAKVLRDIQGGTVPAALAKRLVAMHNNKRRTNLLPEWVWVR